MLNRKSKVAKRITNGLAIAGLFVAFIIGRFHQDTNEFSKLKLNKDYGVTSLQTCSEGLVKAYRADTLIGVFAMGEAQGYGGPLNVCVLADSSARIVDIELAGNSETFAYINKLKRNLYFKQYEGKILNTRFLVGDDVEAVSGATISSAAIANACREASWKVAESVYALSLPELVQQWIFGFKEVVVLILFVLAFISLRIKNKTLRYISLTISLISLGFMFNSAISVSQFGRLIFGYFPDIHQHIVWWVLLGGNLIILLALGTNIYCHTLCPFHAVQILLNKLSGLNLRMPHNIAKILVKTPRVLLWICLVLILVSRNSTIASYEPFSMVFSLEGAGIQWYIMPAALIGSLLMSDFFCRYFCPVGAGFTVLMKYRKGVLTMIKKTNGNK